MLDNDRIKYIVKCNKYLEGGTKEACVKLRQFFQDQSSLDDSHIMAMEVLMAAAFAKDDEMPRRWHCSKDCHYSSIRNTLCRGEMNLDRRSPDLCPYFSYYGGL